MAHELEISPEGELRTGLPLTVTLPLASVSKPRLDVHRLPQGASFVADFYVPLEQKAGHYQAELSLDLPGRYLLRAGSLQREVVVTQQIFLPFAVEFGILSLMVLLLFGGLLLWNRKKSRAGAAAG